MTDQPTQQALEALAAILDHAHDRSDDHEKTLLEGAHHHVRTYILNSTPVAEGWQVVPVEPTWHMLDDGWRMDGIDHARLERAYGAMLARAADPGIYDD